MTTRFYVAAAMDTALRAWAGDGVALERLNSAASRFGQQIHSDDLIELRDHSQLLENLAWGLKELDSGTSGTRDYLANTLDMAFRAWAGDPDALARLNQAAGAVGIEISADDLAEILDHSQLLENVAWGLKELDFENYRA